MAQELWQVELPDGPHQIEARFGYWWPRLRVSVDGAQVVQRGTTWAIATKLGVDQAVAVAGHSVMIQVRPIIRAMLVFGYKMTLVVDGPEHESSALPAAPLRDRSPRQPRSASSWIDAGALSATVGSFVALARNDDLIGWVLLLPSLVVIHNVGTRQGVSVPVRVGAAVLIWVVWMVLAVAIAAVMHTGIKG